MAQQLWAYAHPEMLVETGWLEHHLADGELRIVDCGYPAAYLRGHIPGSVGVEDNYWKAAVNPKHVLSPEEFAVRVGHLGISPDTFVVAYDDRGNRYAARLWWVFRYYGHARVAVLNGGWRKWLAERRPMTMDVPHIPEATYPVPFANPDLIATLEYVKSALKDSSKVVLDVRSREEHIGKDPRQNKRAGHMPGVTHLEWTDNLAPDGTFKPAQELREMYRKAGVAPEKEVLVH